MPSNIQKQAIMHLHGPAEIIAGPGSGKTFTIIHRILYLIDQCQISPDKILVITYTKAAAKEMMERYEQALRSRSISVSAHVHFGTFHSICYHILQQSGVIQPSSLMKEGDRRKLIQTLLGNYGLCSGNDYDLVSNILNKISRRKNSVNEEAFECNEITKEDFERISNDYQTYLHEQKRIDFDDMITECLKLLESNFAICQKYREQFTFILADEFQDINLPQYQILKLLAFPKNNLFVVGDDDQAIYGFRGATPGIMKQFAEDFSEGKQIMLTENYRSGSIIVNFAQKVITENEHRFKKQFFPVKNGGIILNRCFDNRKQEEEQLLKELKDMQAEELGRTAIILRTNMEAILYRELLEQAHIPVKGKKQPEKNLLSSFILNDFISFLSFIYHGHKRADLIRFMNKPDRFFLREAFPFEIITMEQGMRYYQQNPSMQFKWKQFFSQLLIAGNLNTGLALSLYRKTIGYDRYLKEKAGSEKNQFFYLKQADELQWLLQNYIPGTDIYEFIKKEAEKAGTLSDDGSEEAGVSIITMHASKGLEFSSVYLPDVNEGIIPGKKCQTKEALEEERRLLYVAITRAQNTLTIYYTKERNRKISRFLEEIILPHP